ncbi:hypothetical protein [Paraburkholderia rhizosphaerae]|uniref:Uncharacterized protein n=1 Tax=Paraburkholderia rhizosphaerae TaxID=480658 RepID=A0A4R8LM98_9BURK|nr:hypothetical protein [Paraburkholderia rhizosphaerae]TDY46415.1 hypothetical protein BX592_11338 [Paraburkholderia rhizosphaerae]
MSTNIPFIPVEGAVALPSLRALGPISETFGREWALLPPNVSLRVELKALYAAMLRTFCLSSKAFRSMCKWQPQHAQPTASARVTAAIDAASQAGRVAAASDQAAIGMHNAQSTMRASHGASNLRVGSAVAIGGAAMLAWIVLDPAHRGHAGDPLTAPDMRASQRDARIEKPRVPVITSGNPAHHSISADNRANHRSVNPSINGGKSDTGHADVVDATTVTSLHAFASGQSTKASAPHPLTAAHMQAAGSTARHTAQSGAARNDASHGAAASVTAASVKVAPHDSAPFRTRHSKNPTWSARDAALSARSVASRSATASPKPSVAGEYSSAAPPVMTDNDYESVTMFARTHGANPGAHAAAPPRAQGDMTANDTSWMNRMSQRRVTEVPDLFSR